MTSSSSSSSSNNNNTSRDRKPSISATPSYITAGLSVHTISTPDEPPPLPASNSSSNLGGYFSLSRTPSSSKPTRRPSISEPTSSAPGPAFSLKLAHPRTPMFQRTNTLPSQPPPPPPLQPPTSAPGSHSTATNGSSAAAASGATPFMSAAAGGAMAIGTVPPPTSPHAHFTTLHDTCTKRIATLDYLRRSHEGRVYWFNCLLIPRAELQRIVYPDARKLQKKAGQYFLLGNSLPAILELGTSSPIDYLKAFNLLLQEYENYIALPTSRRTHSGSVSHHHHHHHSHHHPPSGASSSAVMGARIMALPKLFSRSAHRRGSTSTSTSASDALERTRSSSHSSDGSGPADTVPPLPLSLMPPSQPAPSLTTANTFAEEYIYLTTPALPFEVDYFEVFVTLCDILVDVYSRVLGLVGTPAHCGVGVGEAFLKADARIRRHLMTGVVREWEEAVRGGVKREVGGVAREVLAGIL